MVTRRARWTVACCRIVVEREDSADWTAVSTSVSVSVSVSGVVGRRAGRRAERERERESDEVEGVEGVMVMVVVIGSLSAGRLLFAAGFVDDGARDAHACLAVDAI